MPGVTGDVHMGYNRHVRLEEESSWGTAQDVSWTSFPILDGNWSVKAGKQLYMPNIDVGEVDVQVVIPDLETPDGGFTTLPWPEVTAMLVNAALSRDGDDDLASFSADYYAPNDSRRFLGLIANTLTITATGTGDGDVQVEVDWMGKEEEANATLVSGDFDYSGLTLVPFRFRDATLQIESSTVIDIEEFTLTVENNLQEGPNVSGKRAYIYPVRRTITLELTKLANDSTFDVARRAGTAISFNANFTHPDGHTWGLDAPRLFVESNEDESAPDNLAKTSPSLTAAHDTTSGYALQSTVSLSGATTTAAPATTTGI